MADAVGLAAELDEPPVVDDAVDHGGGHLVVPEHRPPPAELQVRGDYHRLPLVCVGEDLEEQPRPFRVEREKPELVDDEQAGLASVSAASRSSLPSSRARLRRITSEDAVKKRASSLLSHASAQRADAMCVLPMPPAQQQLQERSTCVCPSAAGDHNPGEHQARTIPARRSHQTPLP